MNMKINISNIILIKNKKQKIIFMEESLIIIKILNDMYNLIINYINNELIVKKYIIKGNKEIKNQENNL